MSGALPDPAEEIRMASIRALCGANYWSRRPVTWMEVDIGAFDEISSAEVPGFTEALVAALPGLRSHRCSLGHRGGFIERLRRGTYAGHVTEHVALELQAMIGHDTGFGRTRGTGNAREYSVVFAHEHEGVGIRAAGLALEIVQRALAGSLDGAAGAVAELRAIAATPAIPRLRPRVACAITGGAARDVAREMVSSMAGGGDGVVDVSPERILHTGLPYERSDVAVVLDAQLVDVPPHFRDAARAARLVAVVADAVPEGGPVVCSSADHAVHELVRDAGRVVVKFEHDGDPWERARRAAACVVPLLGRRAP